MGTSDTSTGAGVAENSAMPTTTNSVSDTPISDTDLQDSPPYTVGEKVYAFHTNRLYEAKVLEVENQLNSWRFFVHYLGWKKSWDEWVGMDRLMKDTEETKRKKRELDEKFGIDKNAKFAARASKTSSVAKGRKRKNGSVTEGKFEENPEKLINIQIPPTLKKQLVDDSEFITHLGKLVKLPRTPNVNDIFKKYSDFRLKKYGSMPDSVKEVLNGLGSYFDKALPVKLLFKNERQQYEEACANNVKPSTIYGAEHLLRLFVKLPELLVKISIAEWTLTDLQTHLSDFLRFLQRNQSEFFLSTYHVPEDIENNNDDKNKQGA